jgi:hypothetical protein|tara:strand:- start:1210 stop:1464 length:255 start_codon:yes stop_codon:yes gene_type:complete
MSRRQRRRKTMFSVIDQIMADGEERTAEAIRDAYEDFPLHKGRTYRKMTPTTDEIRGKLRTEKRYEYRIEGGMRLWKMKTSYTE